MIRPTAQRIVDTLATLGQTGDCWVASAAATGDAHLIPLTYLWDGARLTLATPAASVTARNLARAGVVRIALPSPADVIIIDGPVTFAPVQSADDVGTREGAAGDIGAAYAAVAGWDPRQEPNPYVFIHQTPHRILAWRDVAELTGRVIMRNGAWLADPV